MRRVAPYPPYALRYDTGNHLADCRRYYFLLSSGSRSDKQSASDKVLLGGGGCVALLLIPPTRCGMLRETKWQASEDIIFRLALEVGRISEAHPTRSCWVLVDASRCSLSPLRVAVCYGKPSGRLQKVLFFS